MPLSLVEQSDLNSAITLSLFSKLGDYWGDALGSKSLGSKLLTLKREPVGAETLKRAESYAKESLTGLLEKGLAKELAVKAEQHGSLMRITIEIDGVPTSHVL